MKTDSRTLSAIGIRDTSFDLVTVEDLIEAKVIDRPIDGNHGEIHPTSDEFGPSGVPFVMATDIADGRVNYEGCSYITPKRAESLRKGFARNGDVLLTHKATIGRTAIVDYHAHPFVMLTPQVTYYRVIDPKRLNNRYLRYYFESGLFQQTLNLWADSGSTRAYLGITAQHKLPVILPPIQKQRKIAAVLAAYDDLIEANRRRIALLERMAEEIYREWFVRLRFPGHATTKITKGVPTGWRDGRFGGLCRLKRGYDLPDALITDGPYPVIASSSVKAFHSEFKVEPPVITTGRSGSLGEVLMTNQRAWPLNTSLYVRDFFGNSPYIVFYTLRGMELEKFNSGAGVPTLNRNHLEGLRLAIPPPALQARFDDLVGPMHRQADTLRESNAHLTRTRDLLLPRLISGKLPVEDLPIAFPPSMADAGE